MIIGVHRYGTGVFVAPVSNRIMDLDLYYVCRHDELSICTYVLIVNLHKFAQPPFDAE